MLNKEMSDAMVKGLKPGRCPGPRPPGAPAAGLFSPPGAPAAGLFQPWCYLHGKKKSF